MFQLDRRPLRTKEAAERRRPRLLAISRGLVGWSIGATRDRNRDLRDGGGGVDRAERREAAPRGGSRDLRLDLDFIVASVRATLVPACLIVLTAMRLGSISHSSPGFDGRLYRAAAAAWLAGGDPWQVQTNGVYFAAPPPSLLVMVPFVAVPESLAVAILIGAGLGGSLWAIRRLGMPVWWLAFPPLVDGVFNANPHVLVLPIVVSGAAWLAPIAKIYAAPVLLMRRQFGAVLVAAAVLLVTAPFLPWSTFVRELPWITELLNTQSSGGLSAVAAPVLVVPAIAALFVLGRERAAWWLVPALWPSTQYYYGSLALPALTPIAALVLCGQFPGVGAVAVIVSAAEVLWARRRSAAAGAHQRSPLPRTLPEMDPRADPDPTSKVGPRHLDSDATV
jgi:hypothetical protein